MTTQNRVNWNSGVTAGNGVQCPVSDCGQWFPHHPALIAHMIAVHTLKGELTTVQQNGFELDLLPWESAQDVIDEAEAVLEEKDAKPGLGIGDDSEFDELEFMAATLNNLRMESPSGGPGHGRNVDPLMQDIADERAELAFCTGNSWI